MSELVSLPITDTNGVRVPDSWSAAIDRSALTFFAEEACPDCGKCKRFYVDGLRCYACAQSPAPRSCFDVAADLPTARAHGFRLYTPSAPTCLTHPQSAYITASEKCEECQHEEVRIANEERGKQRDVERRKEEAEFRKLRAEENAMYRALRAEARKAEQAAKIITRTVRARKGSTKTLARAAAMVESLPDTPTLKPRKPRREAAPPSRRKSTRGSSRGKRS